MVVLGSFILLMITGALLLWIPAISTPLLNFQNEAEEIWDQEKSFRNGVFYGLAIIVFFLSSVSAVIKLPWSVLQAVGRRMAWQRSTPIMYLNADQLLSYLSQCSVPVLVDVWAEWCGPCIMMDPVLIEFAKRHRGEIQVVKVNATFNDALLKDWNIRGIPALLLFKDAQKINRHAGAMTGRELELFSGMVETKK